MDIRDKRVLLHICCAPCSVYTIREFRGEGAQLTGYFYNPNIHPYTEFSKRLETLNEYAKVVMLPLSVDASYDLEDFCRGALPLGRDRCLFCYRLRLEKTFQKAAREKFDGVSTTLLYSKYQRHDDIRAIGDELAGAFGIPFIYRDLRKGWQEGIEGSRKLNMYRQQYCGCIFSEKERYERK